MTTDTHPMLPTASHDEAAAQLFVRDLKTFLSAEIEPGLRARADRADPGPSSNARVETVYERLHKDEAFRAWASLRRTSQEMLWARVGESVDRQAATLEARAAAAAPLGSLTLASDFVQPDYLADAEVHIMPGGYFHDEGSVLQGALMDRGGAVYMLGRNGGFLNDGRGKTLLAHLYALYPDLEPARILELGCGVGASIVPIATAFPQAQTYGVDVGASMLRYALARARHLGAAVHFVQDDAEGTRFEDESFDLVFSCALLHETSPDGIEAVVRESRRLLRPGGVVIHLEVPQRYEELDLWGRIRGEIEADYNNEPNWKVAISTDYRAAFERAGFADVAVGYQDATRAPAPGQGGFGPESKGVFRSWFVASARK
ncbi:class I SAM-dependent methyltransferase [Novosphingobium sp. BL-52-GroH]|uniref:class I SAM-dependent methyltransferase n=1 Tax=Novosphingobium sp. BL-52-GroH TaxID=3349877 RepID=UPI00384D687B